MVKNGQVIYNKAVREAMRTEKGGFPMFCTKCGYQNPEGSQYCNHCGELLTAAPSEKKYSLRNSRRRRERSSSKLPLIFAGILVVLAALSVIIYYILTGWNATPPAEIVSMRVDPFGAKMTVNSSQTFTAIGTTSDQKEIQLIDVSWSVNPETLGTIDTAGVFKPSSAGDGEIMATATTKSGGKTATATLSIVSGAVVAKIDIMPASVNLAVNDEQSFRVKALDKSGMEVTITPEWAVLETDLATINENGLFKALKPGNVTITANYNYNGINVSGSAVAMIREGPASAIRRIEISPSVLQLKTGEIYQFIAKGFDRDDKAVTITPSWQMVGAVGNIDANGNFTANQEGQATIEALFEGLVATADITVSAEGLAIQRYTFGDQIFSLDIPDNWEISEGGSLVKFLAPTQTDTLFSYTAIVGYEDVGAKDLSTYVQENKDWALGKFPQAKFTEEPRQFGQVSGTVLTLEAPGYQGLLAAAVSNSTGYYFFGYAPQKNFTAMEATLRRMVNQWAIGSSVSPSPSPTASSGPQTFTSSANGFAFTYPEGWQEGSLPVAVAYITGPLVQNYMPNMSVLVNQLTDGMALQDFAAFIERTQLQKSYADYQSLSLESSTINGLPGMKRVFSVTFQGQPLKDIQYYIVRGSVGTLITFDSSAEAFDSVVSVFDQIVSSFRFF